MRTTAPFVVAFSLAASCGSAVLAQVGDATADVRAMIEDGQYYKLSGPAGPRYFVVGADVSLDRAERRGDALTITLKVEEGHRGIQLLYLGGLAELEFTPDNDEAEVIKVTDNDQTVHFDSPGTLVVKIADVKALKKPVNTADIRRMIEKGQFYKLSGPAGRRYFVVGTDICLDHARLRGDVLTIALKVKESHRGIQLLNLGGLAELEFTPDGEKADVTRITGDDQTIRFESPGTLIVRIRDVKALREPVPPKG